MQCACARFRQGLGETGYVEAHNLAIEYRGTNNVSGWGAELLIQTTWFSAAPLAKEMQSVAAGLGCQLDILTASTIGEIDSAFASLTEKRTDGLFISPSVFFSNGLVQFATLTSRYAIPAIYDSRAFPEVGLC